MGTIDEDMADVGSPVAAAARAVRWGALHDYSTPSPQSPALGDASTASSGALASAAHSSAPTPLSGGLRPVPDAGAFGARHDPVRVYSVEKLSEERSLVCPPTPARKPAYLAESPLGGPALQRQSSLSVTKWLAGGADAVGADGSLSFASFDVVRPIGSGAFSVVYYVKLHTAE